MGLLNRLFGSKKSYTSVLINTQDKIFKMYGVNNPTDAQKMKASVYLCIAGIAILNDLGDGRLRYAVEKLAEETRELTKPLSMLAEELSNNAEQLKKILEELQITTGSTRLNGLAAFEALYFSMGETLMNDMLMRKEGPGGIVGYAPRVVGNGIFGEGRSREHYLELTMQLSNFMIELSAVTRAVTRLSGRL